MTTSDIRKENESGVQLPGEKREVCVESQGRIPDAAKSAAKGGIPAKTGEVHVYKRDYSAVSPAVVKRLPRYFRYLRELLRRDILRISSGELSEMMNVTASQIRQDLNCFGGFGQQGYGYNVKYLYNKISDILGVSANFTAVIIGAGNLGRAITGSNMFEHRSMELIGIFDVSPSIVGQSIDGYTVRSMQELEAFARENTIDIAILTVPKEAAQETADQIAALGVRGIWNFTSTELPMQPGGIMVESVHMGDSLMRLMYEINNNEKLGEN